MKRIGIVVVLCVLAWLASTIGHGSLMAQSSGNAASGTPMVDLRAQEQAEMEAKLNRIKADPEAYRKQGGDPESVLVKKEDKVPGKPIAAPFVAKERFSLVAMQAVPANGMKPSAAELKAETENANHDFPVGKLVLAMGDNSSFQLADGGKMDVRGIAKLEGNQLEWQMGSDDCPTCKKVVAVEVLESSANRLVYLVKGEDGDSPFDYQLTFNRISTSK